MSEVERAVVRFSAPADTTLHDLLAPLRDAGWVITAINGVLYLNKPASAGEERK